MTPDEALNKLIEGNKNYVADAPLIGEISRKRRLEIAKGQTPFVTLVGCSDSRVGPEQLFGAGLGDLFIVRTAGNNVDSLGMGSIEFAVSQLKTPLIVVLGHERCGAVDTAIKVVKDDIYLPGSMGKLIEPIIPAVLSAQKHNCPDCSHEKLLKDSVHENVRRLVHRLRTASEPLLMEPQAANKLKIVGAYYDLESGLVDFFDRG